MVKKTYFFLLFAFSTTSALLSIELTELQTAVQTVKRAYQQEVIKLKKMELLNPDLYGKAALIITRIINSASFKEKMMGSVAEQYNAIVEQGIPFTTIKQDTSLTDFFPNTSSNKYMQTLYAFMANKAYCQLLWQKLFAQEKKMPQQTYIPSEPTQHPVEQATTEIAPASTSFTSEQ